MTYELARQLKDAGFVSLTGMMHPDSILADKERVIIPTLSELIEACGDDFGDLTKNNIEQIFLASNQSSFKIQQGKTPEDAVARLYLSLKGVVYEN